MVPYGNGIEAAVREWSQLLALPVACEVAATRSSRQLPCSDISQSACQNSASFQSSSLPRVRLRTRRVTRCISSLMIAKSAWIRYAHGPRLVKMPNRTYWYRSFHDLARQCIDVDASFHQDSDPVISIHHPPSGFTRSASSRPGLSDSMSSGVDFLRRPSRMVLLSGHEREQPDPSQSKSGEISLSTCSSGTPRPLLAERFGSARLARIGGWPQLRRLGLILLTVNQFAPKLHSLRSGILFTEDPGPLCVISEQTCAAIKLADSPPPTAGSGRADRASTRHSSRQWCRPKCPARAGNRYFGPRRRGRRWRRRAGPETA